jgi:HlyD family secretion protein
LALKMALKVLQFITKRQWLGLIAFILIVIVTTGFVDEFLSRPQVKPFLLSSGSFVQTIVASGHVESPNRISISAQITGTVTDVPVMEGQDVVKGQLLIQLENTELQAALRQAQASEQLALSNLRQLREVKTPIAIQTQVQAEVNFNTAKKNLERILELYAQGFVGATVKDEAERAFQIAKSQLQIGQQQLGSLEPGGSDLALAQAAVNQAHAASESAAARLRYSIIQAPKSGTLIMRNVETGDGVVPGKVLMSLSPTGDIQLLVQIDEKNIKWLHVNQMALASADAYPNQKFQAQLVAINPRIDLQRGSVEVKLTVKNPPIELKQDMTVSVDIEANRIDNALLIPVSAVHDFATHAPWVFLIQEGVAKKRLIGLGIESQGLVQVLSGLSAGDLVVPVQSAEVRDGLPVRVMP